MKATMAAAVRGLVLPLSAELKNHPDGQKGVQNWALCSRKDGKIAFSDDKQAGEVHCAPVYFAKII